MLRLACIFAVCTIAAAQFFFHGGQHEHAELGSFSFYYDPQSHYLVGRTHSNCYYMSLSQQEQHDVHTTAGLEKDELKMIQMITGGEDELMASDLVDHSHFLDYMCRHHQTYKVGMTVTKAPASSAMPWYTFRI